MVLIQIAIKNKKNNIAKNQGKVWTGKLGRFSIWLLVKEALVEPPRCKGNQEKKDSGPGMYSCHPSTTLYIGLSSFVVQEMTEDLSSP